MRSPIAKEGYPFIFPVLLLALFFLGFNCNALGVFFILLDIFIIYFFRDPNREVPDGANLIISPADGKVVQIKKDIKDPLGDNFTQVSIFLSVFNVHINRSPIQGEVVKVEYNKGKFLAAFNEKASLLNEQNAVTIKGADISLRVNQIAGLIARRIVCWVKGKQQIECGERFGLIRFGSRVDIFLPGTVGINVSIGDKVKGGLSVIGTIGKNEKQQAEQKKK